MFFPQLCEMGKTEALIHKILDTQ